MIDERIIKDMKKAQLFLSMTEDSLVVIKDGSVLHKRKGKGVVPFLDLIESTDADFSDCVIGDRLLGRASAFLCRYVHASGVYATKGTKKALAVLMVGGILGQIDTFIPHISNRSQDGLCPFERAVTSIESPEEAYKIIKQKSAELRG
jgi:hypothetical protein